MIYLDHCASAPIYPEVLRRMAEVMESAYGNPGALHAAGCQARAIVQRSRRTLAQLLDADDGEVYFTSGGTESNNWALRTCCSDLPGRHMVVSAQEHKSVLEAAKVMEASGWRLTLVKPDETGLIRPEDIEDAMQPDTVLVSVQGANNETGVLQKIDAIAEIAHRHRARFHCDAVQSFCHVRQALRKADFISVSAHKLGGPVGIGCLVCRYPAVPKPLIYGGGQEAGLRSGTENAAGAAGFALAAELADRELEQEARRLSALRSRLLAAMQTTAPELQCNSGCALTLPGILNCRVPGISAEDLVMCFDRKGICISPGAACSARTSLASHVLLSMGLSREQVSHSVRISLGRTTTEAEIDRTAEVFAQIMSKI